MFTPRSDKSSWVTAGLQFAPRAVGIVLVAFAEIGADHGRIVCAIPARRAVGDFRAMIEHDDMVGDLHHHAHIVFDQQQRSSWRADVAAAVRSARRIPRIETGGGFVETQQDRVGAHGAGDLQPALRSIGQGAGRLVGLRSRCDRFQPICGAFDRVLCSAVR